MNIFVLNFRVHLIYFFYFIFYSVYVHYKEDKGHIVALKKNKNKKLLPTTLSQL